MKLHKKVLLFGASALLLAGCGNSEEDTEETKTSQDTETEEVAEEKTDDTDTKENTGTEENDAEQESAEDTEEEKEEEEEEAERAEDSDKEIVLGEPMEIGDYTLTVQSYELGEDYENNDALIINYDWENNSDEEASPFMTFMFKGFQDDIETDDIFMVDGVELDIGQKEIKSGGEIEGAQDAIGIDDLDEPLLLEVDELITFESDPYSVELDLSSLE